MICQLWVPHVMSVVGTTRDVSSGDNMRMSVVGTTCDGSCGDPVACWHKTENKYI